MKKYSYKIVSNLGNYKTTKYRKAMEFIDSLRDDAFNNHLVWCKTYVVTKQMFHKPTKELVKDLTFSNF